MTCRDCAPICPECMTALVRIDGRVRCACPEPGMSERLERGQVWRTNGRYGWRRVDAVVLPGRPEYDGGLPGVQYTAREPTGRWGQSWFMPAADEQQALERIRDHNYRRFLATDTEGERQ